jgi:glycosyltransferase involved in cell wall biosynthesis
MNPVISIIIPCYNSASTLAETLQSVIEQEFAAWEAIIVNDGSTDATEAIAMEWVNNDKRFSYYSKPNEGLCKTRNFGIRYAVGPYILPLDSDNVILPSFLSQAVEVLDANKAIGVVHGNAEFIGEKKGLWEIPEFEIESMLQDNYIDACAIYRKTLWEQVGGYDEHLPFEGLEDWELWMAFGAIEVRFHHLKKTVFKYRVSSSSMIGVFSPEMAAITRDYIAKKYSSLYRYHYCKYVAENTNLSHKLKNKRFVLELFCKTFLGINISKSK